MEAAASQTPLRTALCQVFAEDVSIRCWDSSFSCRAIKMMSSLVILLFFILLESFTDDVHGFVEPALNGAFGDFHDDGNLWHRQFLLISEGEELVKGVGKRREHFFQGVVQHCLVHIEFGLLLFGGLAVECGEIVSDIGMMPIVILAEVIGYGENPSGRIASLCIVLASFEETEEYVLCGIGSTLAITAQLSIEEPLQPTGIATVEFVERPSASPAKRGGMVPPLDS